ncbi:uncharacterized protein EI97DRAFT_455906 [Westerdykella ornata]|uniref:Hyaluronan/mRNA-binding protein domain-containing protein n=1 Tax=Westerdykella ornata TaxID=318751 RepID=A0A6A6JVC0_WESOR|nr:uncharacterized protein EI97DRAFT_455906 [Westerdykella ornata]KAF2279696.1 hypothetical protein EI97DRAFT_455906 [Westerdykella ornata]
MLVTRSHKFNDRIHVNLPHGGVAESEEHHLPKFFSKTGFVGEDPTKTKKNGGGRGNWGRQGEELEDYEYNMANPRRRSNSSTHQIKDFKTKFETVEPEPVFEEDLHGATGENMDQESTASGSSKSIEEEDVNKKA